MSESIRKTASVTREIRACFNRLRALGDALHRDLAITAAMRAVMEALDEIGEQTVPQIARLKSVTRQHIQVLVNALSGAGLVATRANPDDMRSPLVALTRKGRTTFGAIRQRENAVLGELAAEIGNCDLDATLATLVALRACLDRKLKIGGSND